LEWEFIGASHMASKKLKQFNWEKISVYIAIVGGFFMMINYLFSMKDEISLLRERTARLEVLIKKGD
jgi:hypothetical protein